MKVIAFDAYDGVNTNGTTLQGYVTTTYDKLVEVFGEPTYTDADPYEKVNCEWTVEAECRDDDDERVYKPFSVYSWKYGRIPTEECEWTIGGNDFEAWSIAHDIINK